MDEKLLERIGLTRGEIRVYLALNRLGEATIGPIGDESGISKSKLYDILEKLARKGLVSYVVKEGTKYFSPSDPRTIAELLDKKEEELSKTREEIEKLLPKLLEERSAVSKGRVSEVFEGFNGLKAIREELMSSMKRGEEFLVLGAPKIANEKWEAWFLNFHLRREKRGIPMRIIYNSDAREYGKIRERMKLTHVRYLPNSLVSPTWIDIFPEAILIVIVVATPIALVVRDKKLSESFRSYFEIMWKNSLR